MEELNIQLFADGGDGGADVGVMASPNAEGENVPVAEEHIDTPEERKAKFESLIKNDYKDLYDSRVAETIQKRLKSSKETVDKYNALSPVLDILSRKYGVDSSDVAALSKAVEDDNSYFEDEALEKGITVEQLKSIRKMERENAELKKAMEEQRQKENADRIYNEWIAQEQKAKVKYPSLDLKTELNNPQFVSLLKAHVDVGTAYAVCHQDEIVPAAMQFTAKTIEEKLTNKIASNQARPNEGAMSQSSPALVKTDVASMTKADREEIEKRVLKGEKIRF